MELSTCWAQSTQISDVIIRQESTRGNLRSERRCAQGKGLVKALTNLQRSTDVVQELDGDNAIQERNELGGLKPNARRGAGQNAAKEISMLGQDSPTNFRFIQCLITYIKRLLPGKFSLNGSKH